MERIIERWNAHALEFIGMNQPLKNKGCASFNNWFSDQNGRVESLG